MSERDEAERAAVYQDASGFLTRRLPDGRTLQLLPLLFGARLAIGREGSCYDDMW